MLESIFFFMISMQNLQTLNMCLKNCEKVRKIFRKIGKTSRKMWKKSKFCKFLALFDILYHFFHLFCPNWVVTLYVPWYGTIILENEWHTKTLEVKNFEFFTKKGPKFRVIKNDPKGSVRCQTIVSKGSLNPDFWKISLDCHFMSKKSVGGQYMKC